MINLILGIVTFLLFLYGVYFVFRKRAEEPALGEVPYTLDSAVEVVHTGILKEISVPFYKGFVGEEARKKHLARRSFINAMRKAPHGSYSDKLHFKTKIRQLLLEVYDFESDKINGIMPLRNLRALTVIDKFDILLFKYRKVHGVEAFTALVEKYNWQRERDIVHSFVLGVREDGTKEYSDQGHIIMDEDIIEAFSRELEEGLTLSVDDCIDIITQRVYQIYGGLGVIDELLDMNIDGIRGGTGGFPDSFSNLMGTGNINGETRRYAHDAIRAFYKGISLHLDFLTFGDPSELRRIVNIIYQYAPVGQLNRYNGYKISERADNSRVVSTLPNLTDSPAFFVRKFDPHLRELQHWFRPTDKNWRVIYEWIKWCARGGITTAFTGPQGSGKTTLMRAAIVFLYHTYNIRVQESFAFELWLRGTFWWKDILSFRETDLVSMDEAMSVGKKTDGTMTFVGESAEDTTVAQVIKGGSVASLGTWYSSHENTPEDLVMGHTNALVSTGTVTDTAQATKMVVDVIAQNFHLENVGGHRRMSRCTQFHKVQTEDYIVPKEDSNALELLRDFIMLYREKSIRQTDRPLYTYDNIFEYVEDKGYIVVNKPSDRILEKIRKNLKKTDLPLFEKFYEETFGHFSEEVI